MRRLAALLLLVLSACAAPRAQKKMSFDELYNEPEPSSTDGRAPGASSAGARRQRARRSEPPVQPTDSLEMRAALVSFATRARSTRSQVTQGSPMPVSQADNWREMNALLDGFLRQPARKTSSLDVVRARVTLEAELEEDARTYGDIPSELADAVLTRVDRLAVRMVELRQLQLKPSRVPPRFVWPVDPVLVTSVFGNRRHPITRRQRDHLGVDLAAKSGQLISAAAQGVVLSSGWNGSHGLQVVVQHEGDVTTRYSHLSRVLVGPGEILEQGDVLGLAGKTGLATGVHLHFELWRDGRPIDPLDVLDPSDSGDEEPGYVQRVPSPAPGKRKGRRPAHGTTPRR